MTSCLCCANRVTSRRTLRFPTTTWARKSRYDNIKNTQICSCLSLYHFLSFFVSLPPLCLSVLSLTVFFFFCFCRRSSKLERSSRSLSSVRWERRSDYFAFCPREKQRHPLNYCRLFVLFLGCDWPQGDQPQIIMHTQPFFVSFCVFCDF